MNKLRSVIRTLPRKMSRQLIQFLILSHLDHWKASFVKLLQLTSLDCRVLVNKTRQWRRNIRPNHASDELRILTLDQRIQFKLCLLVFKVLHNLLPQYLRDNINRLALDHCWKWLRSPKLLNCQFHAHVPISATSLCSQGKHSCNLQKTYNLINFAFPMLSLKSVKPPSRNIFIYFAI